MKLCSKIEKKEYLFCSSNNNAYLCQRKVFGNMTTMTLPNDTTLSAMKEAESGEDAGIVNIDSVESFIASMR